MKRRDFITLLGGATIVWPLAAGAQHTERMRRIGLLMGSTESDPESKSRIAALLEGLQQLGWTEGRNLRIDYRWTAAQALPIIFVLISDPVGNGFVESLARPGGNLTGFTNFEFSMGSKWLSELKEIAPAVTRVALIFNPQTAPYAHNFIRPMEVAASTLAVELTTTGVRDPVEMERAISSFAAPQNSGLVVLPDIFTTAHRQLIVELAARHRLPAVYAYRYFIASGGLISYGVDSLDVFRRVASYIDRILKGGSPAELPIQAPTKFEFVINLKTAKALGLEIPPTVLARADEVIE
jgi:putative ABC transport system substrate-binding protein